MAAEGWQEGAAVLVLDRESPPDEAACPDRSVLPPTHLSGNAEARRSLERETAKKRTRQFVPKAVGRVRRLQVLTLSLVVVSTQSTIPAHAKPGYSITWREILASVAECISDCAMDPDPDYDACVEECWDATAPWMEVPLEPEHVGAFDLLDLDRRGLDQLVEKFQQIEDLRKESYGFNRRVELLGELATSDYKDEGLRRVACAYLVPALLAEVAGLDTASPDSRTWIREMAVGVAADPRFEDLSEAAQSVLLAVAWCFTTDSHELAELDKRIDELRLRVQVDAFISIIFAPPRVYSGNEFDDLAGQSPLLEPKEHRDADAVP